MQKQAVLAEETAALGRLLSQAQAATSRVEADLAQAQLESSQAEQVVLLHF